MLQCLLLCMFVQLLLMVSFVLRLLEDHQYFLQLLYEGVVAVYPQIRTIMHSAFVSRSITISRSSCTNTDYGMICIYPLCAPMYQLDVLRCSHRLIFPEVESEVS